MYLFGRVQDFGYEMAEPYAMVASRHHFRIWKSTATYNGQPLWAGAGTHDIGFEKDQRNGKVTPKIDPAVDGERDNIGESLQQAGQVKMMSYFTPFDPVQESRNATGGGFHSDGRLSLREIGISLQFGILRLRLAEERNIGVSLFPGGEEVLVGDAGLGDIALLLIHAAQFELRHDG